MDLIIALAAVIVLIPVSIWLLYQVFEFFSGYYAARFDDWSGPDRRYCRWYARECHRLGLPTPDDDKPHILTHTFYKADGSAYEVPQGAPEYPPFDPPSQRHERWLAAQEAQTVDGSTNEQASAKTTAKPKGSDDFKLFLSYSKRMAAFSKPFIKRQMF